MPYLKLQQDGGPDSVARKRLAMSASPSPLTNTPPEYPTPTAPPPGSAVRAARHRGCPSRDGSHLEMVLEHARGIGQAGEHIVARERWITREHVLNAVARGKEFEHGARGDARTLDDRLAIADIRIDDDLPHVTIIAIGKSVDSQDMLASGSQTPLQNIQTLPHHLTFNRQWPGTSSAGCLPRHSPAAPPPGSARRSLGLRQFGAVAEPDAALKCEAMHAATFDRASIGAVPTDIAVTTAAILPRISGGGYFCYNNLQR